MNNIQAKYQEWLANVEDIDLRKELLSLDEKQKEDAFYKDLEFGTGGLRGVMGAGTNRMNLYTVAKATQGLAIYIKNHFKEEERKVAISRDSRLNSDAFSNIAARVLAANGIEVFIYPYISPVPTLSFATIYLKCCAGIMITASHNPSKYNGYKVYQPDGCHISSSISNEILGYINQLNIFSDVKLIDLDEGFDKGLINYIKPNVLTAFINEVKKQSLLGDEKVDKDVAIIYSPLNGTGLLPVTRTLKEMGYTNITVVKEQELPNGYFPTCPYPNPEIREAMALGMEYAKEKHADLLLATDPDCDRVGIAVLNKDGEYQLLSGNETGTLLFDYICQRRIALSRMPKDPVMVKSIVTTDFASRVASKYNVKTINVLTGSKYIGEQIAILNKEGHPERYLFGFEESYGFLVGTYIKDKDAVGASLLIVEMFAYYKSKGLSLLDRLEQLYQEYGYTLNTQHSFTFEGKEGFDKMQSIMNTFRKGLDSIAGLKVLETEDYKLGFHGLPKSNVLRFILEDHCSLIVRPSGTEPKLKSYIEVVASSMEKAKELELSITKELEKYFK